MKPLTEWGIIFLLSAALIATAAGQMHPAPEPIDIQLPTLSEVN